MVRTEAANRRARAAARIAIHRAGVIAARLQRALHRRNVRIRVVRMSLIGPAVARRRRLGRMERRWHDHDSYPAGSASAGTLRLDSHPALLLPSAGRGRSGTGAARTGARLGSRFPVLAGLAGLPVPLGALLVVTLRFRKGGGCDAQCGDKRRDDGEAG